MGKTVRHWTRRTLTGAVCTAALLAFLPAAETAASGKAAAGTAAAEVETRRFDLPDLSAPGEILVDEWGLAHIRAQTTRDAFFLQGFNAARDRLWQIDLWRRKGLGLLSEVLGPDYVEQDKASRLLLYRGDMDAEWASYGADARGMVSAFAAGVNAFVRLTQDDPDLLPIEFKEAGYEPALWSPGDVVRIRAHGLIGNVTSEVARARTLCTYGPAGEALRRKLQPAVDLASLQGVDPCSIPEDVLKLYRLARAPVRPASEAMPSSPSSASQPDLTPSEENEGSNNWAIAPSRSATGRPIVADDPHRRYGLPSLRYMVHVDSPELSFIGGGEPFAPGISIGHNGHVAFGLTVFYVDQEDLYVYDLNPEDSNQYRYKDEWVSFETQTETIPVRDGAPVVATLSFSRHGPVIYRDEGNNRAYALRSLHFAPGTSAYLGSLDFQDAKTVEEVITALNTSWGGPGENYVMADTQGTIAWRPAAFMPHRPNWYGLLPVTGDGRFEWEGIAKADELPYAINPESGYIATANERNVPPETTLEDRRAAFEWSGPARFDRIKAVLEAQNPHTFEDSLALQNDVVSVTAQETLARLARLETDNPDTLAALALLEGWDAALTEDSAPAALFSIWFRDHLPATLFEAATGKPMPEGFIPSTHALRDHINDARTASGGAVTGAAMDRVLITSLAAAVLDIREKTGGALEDARWGDFHRIRLRHPFAEALPGANLNCANAMDTPLDGGPTTVDVAHAAPPGFTAVAGPSFRIVMDVGAWDNSVAVNMPGQSGDPSSPNYCNLMSMWHGGDYFPLLFSWDKVEEAARTRIELNPIAPSSASEEQN